MRIHLPEQITGSRDSLFLLDIQVPATDTERQVEVATQGALLALDVQGTGPGGRYTIPAGQEQLQVPLRVTADGAGQATVVVSCASGPEAGQQERCTVQLMAPGPALPAQRSRSIVPVLLLSALLLVGLFVAQRLSSGATAPSVVGKRVSEATSQVKTARLSPKVTYSDVAELARDGVVLSQQPAGGTRLESQATVGLVVGRYVPPQVVVPELVGDTAESAESALRTLGFQPVLSYRPVTEAARAGRVLAQSPAGGTTLQVDSVVEVFVGRAQASEAPVAPVPADPVPASASGTTQTQPQPPATPSVPAVPVPAVPVPPSTPSVPVAPPGERGVKVPDVMGLSRSDAEWKLADAGLMAEFRDAPAPAGQAGKVVTQEPAAGVRVESLSSVVLGVGRPATEPVTPEPSPAAQPATTPVVEQRPEPTPVPVSPQPAQPEPVPAQPAQPAPVEPAPVEPVPVGPAPPAVPEPGSPGAVPSQPPPPVEPAATPRVPDLVGLWRDAAEVQLRQASLPYEVVLRSTYDLEDGRVLAQVPGPGEVLAAGQSVMLEVARAPSARLVRLPDLRGLRAEQATEAVRDAGLLLREVVGTGTASEQGTVVDQAPAAGTEVAPRSWVEVVVARSVGPSPQAQPSAGSAGMPAAPTVVPGATVPVLPTPAPPAALPVQVRLPGRDVAPSLPVPAVVGQPVRQALEAVLRAGQMPIVDNDRSIGQSLGSVLRQQPDSGALARAGDLVRLLVALGPTGNDRSVTVPAAYGVDLKRAQQVFTTQGLNVEVIVLAVPGHPYTGSERVVAQFPVGVVGAASARTVTVWVLR